MGRILALTIVLLIPAEALSKELAIYFIDVEGGQATLVVTPAGQSLLIDAGYGRTSRDPDRIMAAVRDAGLTRIDYLLVTHFHNDHVGGVSELMTRIPIGAFIDYGRPLGTPYGADGMMTRAFANYAPVRAMASQHLVPQPGDRLPLTGVEAVVVSAGGALLSTPLAGAGRTNEACDTVIEHGDDGTENFRSVGIVLRYGDFRFVDLGDLSGDTLPKLVCPDNLIGEVSAYLIAHHGSYDSDAPAVYAALKPQVAIMNNGARKGGHPVAFGTAHAQPAMDLWQLHASLNPGAVNSADELIANLDDQECQGHWIRLVANEDGSFNVTNARTGHNRTYPRRSIDNRP
jgi:beta-lactamase superfamily II metal-dependent hydrolase